MSVRVNLDTNPNFEAGGLTGVAAIGSTPTLDATVFKSGAQSVKVVTAGAATLEGVTITSAYTAPDPAYYSVGFWANVPNGQSMTAFWRVNGLSAGQGTVTFIGTGAWQFVICGGLPFSGVNSLQLHVRTTTQVAITFWVDSVVMERAPFAGGFFDGSTAPGVGHVYAWTGAVGSSTSTDTYGNGDAYSWFAARSGLSSGALEDHMMAYFKTQNADTTHDLGYQQLKFYMTKTGNPQRDLDYQLWLYYNSVTGNLGLSTTDAMSRYFALG